MKVQARAGRIYVDDAGKGDTPVLFVHSLAGNTTQWEKQLEHVRKNGCGIAIDMRGHGRSDAPRDGDYSFEASADDIQAVMDALGVDRAILVGHSLGAAVAARFAATRTERVAGLFLVDPVGDQRLAPDEMQQFLVALESAHYERFIRDYWRQIIGPNEELQARLLKDLDETPRATVVGMLWALQRTNLTNCILGYNGPKIAVVTPLNDFPFSLHNIDPALQPPTVIEGTGHWLQLEKPDEFNAILDRFIARVAQSNAAY
jgi:pimeloyl-ACP methyl ester carboxylesterase